MKKQLSHLLFFAALPVLPVGCLQAQTPTPTCCRGIVQAAPTASLSPNLTGVAVDMARGLVYAEDINSNQIDVFTTAMAYVRSFGSPGQFNRDVDLRVGPDQLLYVSEDSGQDLQVVDPNTGNTLARINLGGYGRGLFVDGSGDIYATAFARPLVFYQRLPSCTGTLYDGGTTVTLNGDPDPPDEVYDAWSSGTTFFTVENSSSYYLNQYSRVSATDFNFVARQATSGPGQLNLAGDLVQDTAGNYFAKSAGDGSIVGFDTGFNFIFRCPISGMGTGSGIGVDNGGNVYATGAGNGVVYQLHQGCLAPGSLPPTLTATPSGCPSTATSTPTASPLSTGTPTQTASPVSTATPTPTPSNPGSITLQTGESFIYPSPVKGAQASLAYNMAESGNMTLKIFTRIGELAVQVTDHRPAGVQTTAFNVSGFAPGVYFFTVTLNYDSGQSESIPAGKFAVVR